MLGDTSETQKIQLNSVLFAFLAGFLAVYLFVPMGQKATKLPAHFPAWGPHLPSGEQRVAVITGANSGLGYECAKQMLIQGYRVVIACRNPAKAEAAVQSLVEQTSQPDSISSMTLDVSSLASVNSFAQEYLSDESRKIHVLVCNAGIMMGAQRTSADGFDLQLATNYLGHFHLVNLLRDRLVASAPARVIHVSSIAARFGHIYWDNINFTNVYYDSLRAYQQSKLLQVVYSRELAKRLEGTGVTSNSLEPGIVKTSLSEGITDDPSMRRRLENGVSVEEGVKTHIKLATGPIEGTTGEHWENEIIISQGLQKFKYLMAAHDLRASVGPKLWDFTEELIRPKLEALEAASGGGTAVNKETVKKNIDDKGAKNHQNGDGL